MVPETQVLLEPVVVQAEEIEPVVVDNSPETIKSMIRKLSREYGVNPELVLYIAQKESSFNTNAVGDMKIFCARTNSPVRARGLFQITECFFPDITDEQAFDYLWSAEWAIKQLSEGKKRCLSLWTSCRMYYNNNI